MLQEFRCSGCNKLLGKIEGRAEIICTRCKVLNAFNVPDQLRMTPEKNWYGEQWKKFRELNKLREMVSHDMTKLEEVLSRLYQVNEWLIKEEYKSHTDIHVGVRMHPKVFREIVSDKDAYCHMRLDLLAGVNMIDGFPIEISTMTSEYEIVELSKFK